jgi:hypothetical protein
MKNHSLIFLLASIFLTSCVSMKHTYRSQDVQPSGIMVADNYVADLDINFKKTISGETSRQHKSESQAKQEAYFNAISSNNVHVLVDPIYSVSSTKRLFGSTSTAKVYGFGALYENPRIAGAGAEGTSSATVSDRLAQLERFAKIEGVQGGLTKASYAIDTRGCCDGNTDGSSFGSTHLLHASENATSLVDEFEKFLELTEGGSGNTMDLNVGMNSANSEKKRGLISNILGRLPIVGRIFR